ncbi:MAG: adenine phosphoribosyltransferase [Candidatus Kaelpia imicola]|nr:adenine phosphoribosyltransferase [Candidatus Kaelpia imicola]
MDLSSYIREVMDFPKEGIGFKDITTLLKDGKAFSSSVDALYDAVKDYEFDKIVAIESRGFIFGAALAYKMGVGFVPVRKEGKLPSDTVSVTYELEYGQDTLQMHSDALSPAERVLIIDDLLATGGTAAAAAEMVKKAGAEVALAAFLIELEFLEGREKLKDYPILSLIKY